ncbi:hypothetical protein BKA62DRAFT_299879 [Auriculariales sp. MPI-PUGE-AT-0066]|nr:hypothetical protein BKA62DRAFT_299879 [Auriculariales sp. MPI-PUGE-AT-0066]
MQSLRTDVANKKAAVHCSMQQLHELRRAHWDAEAALAHARVRLVETKDALKAAEEYHVALSTSFEFSRRAYHGACLQALPLDVLRHLFDFVRTEHIPEQPQQFGFSSYDIARKAIPFRLAAVCRRWQSVAFSQPSLWSYISAGSRHWTQADLDSVVLLLRRSASADLEIVLRLNDATEGSLAFFEAAIMQTAAHFGRARKVEVELPVECSPSELLHALRRPTPSLTHLSLDAMDWNCSDRSCLPLAPRLTTLDLAWPSFSLPPRHFFPSLTTLRIWNETPLNVVISTLHRCAPTLKTLFFRLSQGDIDDSMAEVRPPVTLPFLETLELVGFLPGTQLLDLPALRRLVIAADVGIEGLLPIIERVRGTVTELTLFATTDGTGIGVASLPLLARLDQIDSLEIIRRTGLENDYRVPDGFFKHIAETTPPMWPRLSRIIIENIVRSEWGDSSMGPGRNLDEEILLLVQGRNPPLQGLRGTNAAGQQQAARLQEVRVRCTGFGWLQQTIDGLLAQ